MIDIDLTNYISDFEVDKIIATFTGTISIPAGGSNFVDHPLPVEAGYTFWAGTYTLAGSTQQNDIGGMQYSGLTGVGLEARSFIGGIRVRGQNGTGSTQSATYFIAVIASPQTGSIPSVGTFAPRVTTFAFDSRDNHQKIALETTSNATPTSFPSLVYRISHNFGMNPKYRIFIQHTDGFMYDAASAYQDNLNFVVDNTILLTSAFFYVPPPYPVVYVRFYYD